MFEPAERLKNVKVSASSAMTRKVRELRAQGVKIVGLSSGEPDFMSPRHAIEAGYKAALAGDTKYPPQDGTKALKEAVRETNPGLMNFETSCFDGRYITGDVTSAYLDAIELRRDAARDEEEESPSAQLDLNLVAAG